jgi:hypothetical protein
MFVDQLKNVFAASFDFGLESTHRQKLIAR